MIKRWTSTSKGGDPVLHIEVTGEYDIYRFSDVLTRGQVEFCEVGRWSIQRLKRRMGRDRFGRLMRLLYGDGNPWGQPPHRWGPRAQQGAGKRHDRTEQSRTEGDGSGAGYSSV